MAKSFVVRKRIPGVLVCSNPDCDAKVTARCNCGVAYIDIAEKLAAIRGQRRQAQRAYKQRKRQGYQRTGDITHANISPLIDKRLFKDQGPTQRKKFDLYETPYSMTGHLLCRERFDVHRSMCEPACGHGAIVKVLRQRKWRGVVAYDIQRGTDFLQETRKFDYIVTNPPYALALEFMLKAKQVATKKFAFLMPLNYLHGQRRFEQVYSDRAYGLKKVWVFTRYPRLGEPLRSDGKYGTGLMVYAWYVFENGYAGKPEIDWIDNSADVLNKNDDQEELGDLLEAA